MQIAQYIAESGKLVNGVVRLNPAVEAADHARRAPPPPILGRTPCLRKASARQGQPLHANPRPEPAAPHAVGAHELESPLEVRQKHEHESRARCRDPRDSQLGAVRSHEGVYQTEDSHRRHCGNQRQGEVVRHARHDARQLGQQGKIPIPKVVVANAFAPKPWILRRSQERASRAVEEHEIHRLLGVANRWVVRPVDCPRREHDEEHRMRQRQRRPFSPHELDDLSPIAPKDPGRHASHDQQQQ